MKITAANSNPFPLKLNRAKPYPTNAEIKVVSKATPKESNAVFTKVGQ